MNEKHANDVRRLDAALRQPDDERHLDADTELFPFVDGTADAATRELVVTHVEECAICRAELTDLQTLRHSMERPRPNRVRTFAIAAMIVLAIGALLAWIVWRRPSSSPPAQVPIVDAPRPRETPRAIPTAPERKPEWQKLVDDTLARGSLPVAPIVSTVALSGHTLRGPNAHLASGLTPAGVVIESDRPTLAWKATDDATYVVTIYESEREIANSGALDRPSWTPPRLPRGKTYLWQVKVTRGDEVTILPSPPEPPALFHVLGDDALRELAAARAERPDDHLLLAVLSARHGLEAETKAHLDKVPLDVRRRIQP